MIWIFYVFIRIKSKMLKYFTVHVLLISDPDITMANKARECTNYSITEEDTTTGYSQVLDSRENAAGVRNVYIGSSTLLKIRSSAVMGMHDIPVSYILASKKEKKFWTGLLIDNINEGTETHFILDIGYELIKQNSVAEIVDFAEHMVSLCDAKNQKMVLATMTIMPELQSYQKKILQINEKFNEINIANNFTPHYGIRSVMKFHKKTGSYKIRPLLWEEWKDNSGYGHTLTSKGGEIYIQYQVGYFKKGFAGTEREGNIKTRVKNQALQVQNRLLMDARIVIKHKQAVKDTPEEISTEEPEGYVVEMINYLENGLNKSKKKEGEC